MSSKFQQLNFSIPKGQWFMPVGLKKVSEHDSVTTEGVKLSLRPCVGSNPASFDL